LQRWKNIHFRTTSSRARLTCCDLRRDSSRER
jgi:hypothetical protein